jgi:hypothetical protein
MGLLNLTESERLEILNLHNNARIIKEQAAPTVPAAAGTPAAAPQTVEEVIKELQTLLNTKYGAKLAVDGKWGNLTQTAFETALKSKGTGTPRATGEITPPVAPVTPKTVIPGTPDAPNPNATPATGTTPAAPTASTTTAPGVSGQPAPASATTATPEVPAAPATPAAPLSNRDQRRQRQDLRRGNRRAMQDLRGQQRAQ